MAEPSMPQKAPYAVELAPGDYWWCACGLSKRQPFCDGSHKETSFVPIPYTASLSGDVYFCGCKASKNKPLCDGSHKAL